MALVGDYSPRTERILPRQIRLGKNKFSTALGPVNPEAVAFGFDRTHA